MNEILLMECMTTFFIKKKKTMMIMSMRTKIHPGIEKVPKFCKISGLLKGRQPLAIYF